jgi:hypothetical protein
MTDRSWYEQWTRVRVGHGRLHEVYAGRPGGTIEAEYDMVSFFLHCFHLKDWLKNDPHGPDADVEAWVANSEPLRVCADFANNAKHLQITQTFRDDAATWSTQQNVTFRAPTVQARAHVGIPGTEPRLVDPTSGPLAAHSWRISSAERSFDALELADACVASWREFLDLAEP